MNSARAILERLAFVLWLALTGSSIGAALLSAWFDWPAPGLAVFLAGSGGSIFSALLRHYGRARLHFEECEASLEFGLPRESARAEHLRRVFDSWEALDAQRESGGIDVWRVHELRREAASLLEAEPALRATFERELSRRPELRDR